MVDIYNVAVRASTIGFLGAQKESKKLTTTLAATEKQTKKTTSAFKLLSGLAIGATFAKAVHDIAQFDESLKRLQATVGATTEQMISLEKQARTLGATTAFTAKQAAEAQNFLAMAGFEVNEVLKATPGLIKLSTVANIDLAESADLASNVLSGMALEVQELGRVNDVLVKTATSSNTSVLQLGRALSYVAPFAETANISIESISAAIGKLGDAGIQSERAGRGLVGVIRQFSKVTPAGEKALARYGLTIEDVSLETHSFQDVIETLAAKNISLADTFNIFGTEAGVAGSILLKVTDDVRKLEEANIDAAGSMDKAANIIGSSLSFSLKGLNSAISESILQLGEYKGGFNTLVIGLTGVINEFNGLLPQFAEANNLSTEFTNNIQAAAKTLSLLGTAVGIYTGLAGAIWLATNAQKAFNIAARLNPYVLIASVVAAATIEIIKLKQANEDVLEIWEQATESEEKYQAALTRRTELDRKISAVEASLRIEREKLLNTQDMLTKNTGRYRGVALETQEEIKNKIQDLEEELVSYNSLIEEAEKASGERAKAEKERLESEKKAAQEALDYRQKLLEQEQERVRVNTEYDILVEKYLPEIAAAKELKEQLQILNKAEEAGRSKEEIEAIRIEIEKLQTETKKALEPTAKFITELEKLGFTMGKTFTKQIENQADALEILFKELENGNISFEEFRKYQDEISKQTGIGDLGKEAEAVADNFDTATESIGDTARAMQSMFEKGSSGYRTMTVAINVLNTAQKINHAATLKNASAFSQLSSVATAALAVFTVASSLLSPKEEDVNNYLEIQAKLGTGTVLGGSTFEQSESMVNSLEMIAETNQEIVALNQDLLKTFQKTEGTIEGFAITTAELDRFAISGTVENLMFATYREGFYEWENEAGTILSSFFTTNQPIMDRISDVFDDFTGNMVAMGDILGLETDDIADQIQKFRLGVSEFDFTEMSAEERLEAINNYFSATFDMMATSIFPWLREAGILGEGLSETLVRVTNAMQVTTYAAETLGFALDKTVDPVELAKTSADLALFFEDTTEFSKSITNFIDNFATEERKLQIATERMQEAFGDNFALIKGSADAYRELMEAQDASTESGRETISQLLKMSDTAKEYYDLLEKRNEDVTEQIQIESDKILQIYRDRVDAAQEILSNAETALDKAFEAQQEKINEKYTDIIDGFSATIDAMSSELSGLKNLADSLRSASFSMFSSSQPQAAYSEIQASLFSAVSSARMGDFDPALGLQDNLSTLTQDTSDFHATFEDYQRDFFKTQRGILELEKLTENQVSETEQIINSLEDRKSEAESQHKKELENLEAQLEFIKGIQENVLGIDQASREYYKAQQDYNSALDSFNQKELELQEFQTDLATKSLVELTAIKNAIANMAINGAEEKVFDELGYIQAKVDLLNLNQRSIADNPYLTEAMKEAEKWTAEMFRHNLSVLGLTPQQHYEMYGKSEGIKGFANGGYHSGGLRIVGENGPELEATPSSQIMSNKRLVNKDEMVEAIHELKQEIRSGNIQISKNTNDSLTILKTWNTNGLPEERTA